MSDPQSLQIEPTALLPPDLIDEVERVCPRDEVLACAPFDLSEQGRYLRGYLVLIGGRLGSFVQRGLQWESDWLDLAGIEHADLVEGLGLNVLRLADEGSVRGEWRFTRRHEKQIARLHRLLERQVTGEEGDALEGRGGGHERKLICDKCGQPIPDWSEHCPACMSRRKVLWRLLDFVKPYKGRAVAGLVVALLVTGTSLVQPWLARPMVDRGLGAAEGARPDWNVLLTYVSILAGLIFLQAIGGGAQARLMAGLGTRVAGDVRDTAYRHLQKLSLSFFTGRQTGGLVTRVTSDSDRLWDFVAFTIVELGVSVLTLFGVVVALFVMNWKLALVVLLPLPVMIGMMVFFHKRMHHVFHRIFHRWSQMTAVIADALPGVRVIKAFSQEEREIRRFGEKNRQVVQEESNLISTWTTYGPLMRLCSNVGTILVWLLGGAWVIRDWGSPAPDAMTAGTLVAFIGYMGLFHRPVHQIAHMDRLFNRAATSAQRIFEILDTPPQVYSKVGALPADNLRGRIELRNVTFSYDGVRRVLKNVSVDIAPGEMIGLAGPSGSGKTTLINLICRFYDVLEGAILIDGVDVRDYDLHELRRRIGVVLQEPFLFHGTVAENIAYGNEQAGLDEIIEAARAAHAHEFIVGFPDGYDTLVGERGQTLSGGERQRISIARAVLHNPRILILDEATSSVDTESETLIQDAIGRLIAQRTTIAIAHRLSTLRRADRLVILDKGELIEKGPHDELAEKPGGTYAKLLRMQRESQSYIALSG
jgi:ATP-binding cassette subfamily B protein